MATCEAIYLDAALTYEGTPTNSFSGLSHLAGEYVTVWADGVYYGSVLVSETGYITLGKEASKVIVGINYESAAETMPIERDDIGGLSHRNSRVAAVIGRLWNTLAGTVAINDNTAEPMYDPNATRTELFTGNIRRNVQGGTSEDMFKVRFEQTLPAPMTVLALVAEMEAI